MLPEPRSQSRRTLEEAPRTRFPHTRSSGQAHAHAYAPVVGALDPRLASMQDPRSLQSVLSCLVEPESAIQTYRCSQEVLVMAAMAALVEACSRTSACHSQARADSERGHVHRCSMALAASTHGDPASVPPFLRRHARSPNTSGTRPHTGEHSKTHTPARYTLQTLQRSVSAG